MNKILSLFIQKGFDCSRLLPSNGEDNHLELWGLTFSISEDAYDTLKILIENGISVKALEDFIDHFYMDCEMVDGSDVYDEKEKRLKWAFRMIMLCASYPHILNGSKYLQSCIELDSTNKDNKYDLTKFRDYKDYTYRFDYSTMDNIPHGMRNAKVEILEKESETVIWTMYI